MNAIRCDRCKKYAEYGKTLAGAGILGGIVRPMYYPENVDLCKDCAQELRAWLKVWFSTALARDET